MLQLSDKRYLVARKIQKAAVWLAMREGLNKVTTKSIAHEAGVSPRTFFNYYPFKEAAVFGPQLDYSSSAVTKLISSKSNLLEDLIEFAQTHLRQFLDDRALFSNIIVLRDANSKLVELHSTYLVVGRSRLTNILSQRLPGQDQQTLEILASAVTTALINAVENWATDPAKDLLEEAKAQLQSIVKSLSLLQDAAPSARVNA